VCHAVGMETELNLTEVPGTPVLVGVGGSHAYGLAHAESDVDYRGCYVAPTRAFFGLTPPKQTYDRHDPDLAMHEVGKTLQLASGGNPTVLELFFYEDYACRTEVGDLLIANSDLFITGKIRDTHLGYARQQFTRLIQRQGSFSSDTAKRTEKHARHMFRLMQLAEDALTTGVYTLQVRDRDEIFALGKLPIDEMTARAEAEFDRLNTIESVLPPAPDMEAINNLLVHIRTIALDW
jgi:hypothetical protein